MRSHESIESIGWGAVPAPLSIGIYWDCFGSVSIAPIDGIFLEGLTVDVGA